MNERFTRTVFSKFLGTLRNLWVVPFISFMGIIKIHRGLLNIAPAIGGTNIGVTLGIGLNVGNQKKSLWLNR